MKAPWKRSKKSLSPANRGRRRVALALLQDDLKSGYKRVNGNRTDTPLTDYDIKRIKKEIENIQAKM